MKTKKLNLNNLKVESFVTSLEAGDSQTIKGGYSLGSVLLGYGLVASLITAMSSTLVVTVFVDPEVDNNNAVDNNNKEKCE